MKVWHINMMTSEMLFLKKFILNSEQSTKFNIMKYFINFNYLDNSYGS